MFHPFKNIILLLSNKRTYGWPLFFKKLKFEILGSNIRDFFQPSTIYVVYIRPPFFLILNIVPKS